MSEQEIVLYIIKLSLSGIAAFLAIALWHKTRDAAWMCIVAGAITGYAGLVFNLLVSLGFSAPGPVSFFQIPLSTFLFAIMPALFFILAFIIMLTRKY